MIKLEVTEEELRLIVNSLAELPYKVSAQLLSKIQFQVMEQKKEEPKKEEVK